MLRIWIEPGTVRDGGSRHRISIEHAGDGGRVFVTSYDDIPAALRQLLDELETDGGSN